MLDFLQFMQIGFTIFKKVRGNYCPEHDAKT